MYTWCVICSVRVRHAKRSTSRRSINVSRGVISFSTDSCVKYQIKCAECLFKWSFVETVAAAVDSSGTVGRGWIFDATCAGEETLISRYRVCSELAGSQSERVLTLAAHSTLPSVSACPPPSPLSPPAPEFRPSHPFPVCALRLPCYLCRRRKPPLPPTTSASGESSNGVPPLSRPSNFFFLFAAWKCRSSCRQYRLDLITFMRYFLFLLAMTHTNNETIQFSDKD